MSIDEIIAALETATGPDRELDAAIYILTRGWTLIQVPPDYHGKNACEVFAGPEHKGWSYPNVGSVGRHYHVPRDFNPTASIDAALSLVPRDGSVSTITLDIWLDFNRGGKDVTDADLKLVDPEMDAVSLGRCSMAEHPAIALCIAALKARQATS